MVTMLNCDCMDYMRGLPDKAFELAIVDPPYGINWTKQVGQANKGHNWNQWEPKPWDTSPPKHEYFLELSRVSSNQIIWGANYFENIIPSPCWIIWDKIQEFSGASFEMAWTSFSSPSKAFRMARCEAYVGVDKIHPTQKPVALYKWLLSRYAKPGDKILDTHGGSGSICIACHDLGFDLTWMELDGDYYDAAVARYQSHAAQAILFEPQEMAQIEQKNLFTDAGN